MFFYSVFFPCHLPSSWEGTEPCGHSLWLSKVCVGVCGDLSKSLDFRLLSFPSFPLSIAQFCLSEHTDFFFFFSIIVASVECVAVLSSGGFGRVWTNDLSSFVMCLKRMGYKCLLQRGTVHVECSFFKYLFLWWYVILYKRMLVAYKQIAILFLNYLYLLSM